MDIATIAELAKKGGKLDNTRQWELADALSILQPDDITEVSIRSGRNVDTLMQYARAAQRWHPRDRVSGVSFSAHRVALSWHMPRDLLVDLKGKYGSPTVSQVRQAMGLEGHPAIELIERGYRKIDDDVSYNTLTGIILKLSLRQQILKDKLAAEGRAGEIVSTVSNQEEDDSYDPVIDYDPPAVEKEVTPVTATKWTPPISTADVAGM